MSSYFNILTCVAWLSLKFGFLTEFIGLFVYRASLHNVILRCTHSLLSSVTPSLSLLVSGFQHLIFRSLWVHELSPCTSYSNSCSLVVSHALQFHYRCLVAASNSSHSTPSGLTNCPLASVTATPAASLCHTLYKSQQHSALWLKTDHLQRLPDCN
jgi:hypothetical protein